MQYLCDFLQEERSLENIEMFLRSTNLQDLDLTGVRIHISPGSKSKSSPDGKSPGASSIASILERRSGGDRKQKEKVNSKSLIGKKSSISSVMSLGGLMSGSGFGGSGNVNGSGGGMRFCPNLAYLRIGGMQVEFGKSTVWRSMDVLSYLLPYVDKGKITHLDLRVDKNDTNFTLDDKIVLKTLKLIGHNFPKLQRLVLQHWRMKISEKTCKEAGKYLQGLTALSSIIMDNSVVSCETGGTGSGAPSKRIDHIFTSALLSSVKYLSDFSWANFDPIQMPQFARALCEHPSVVPTLGGLTVKLESVPLAAIKLLISNSLVKSNSSGVLIEYAGNHSVLVRKHKDRSDLMHKLKRFL